MALKLSEELTEFIESGVSMIAGTRDAALRPCVSQVAVALDNMLLREAREAAPTRRASHTLQSSRSRTRSRRPKPSEA